MRSFSFATLAYFLLFSFITGAACAQNKPVKMVSVGFYNLENLFDTINDPNTNDEEFLPEGANRWNTSRYNEKLKNLAEVIVQIGDEYIKGGPAVLGFSEVENRVVVEDLVRTEPMAASGYAVAHIESADRRGIDVGFIYRPSVFQLTNLTYHRLQLASNPNYRTRDVVVMSGTIDGEMFYFLVNHWPSRSSGQKETEKYRFAMASLCRTAVDSIFALDEHAKIIIMGDLNDDPIDASVVRHLGAKFKIDHVKPKGELFNPMYQLYRDGIGSLAYRDSWNLFDQLIISSALLDKSGNGFRFLRAKVFNRNFLLQKEGQYKGYPLRTFAGGVYTAGYSDHLPVYLFLVKEQQ